MLESDKPEFFKLITDVHKFYRQETSAFSLQVWWTTMQQFDFAAVREAMGRHAMNPDSGQFLPKPADVVKALNSLGATPQDLLAILQAMKSAGALNAEIEVI